MTNNKPEKFPTVAGVVLLVEQHTSFFSEQLVPNLREFTRPFDELIIIASGLSKRARTVIGEAAQQLPKDWKISILDVSLGTVGKNRNRGLEASESEIVTFLDSDDYFSPDYCRFIVELFTADNFDIMVHGYVRIEGESGSPPVLEFFQSGLDFPHVNSQDFLERAEIDWDGEPTNFASTGLEFSNPTQFFPITHGHMTVARTVPLRFHQNSLARNEDGVFLHRALHRGLRVHAYPLQLSGYRLWTSAQPFRYRLARRIWSFTRRTRQHRLAQPATEVAPKPFPSLE